MKKLIVLIVIAAVFSSFISDSLKGTWQYCGGISNGKKTETPTAYTLQRVYDRSGYEAFVLEQGEQPFKYEAGEYRIKADTCFETQTYSRQPSGIIGVTVPYHYIIRNDTLIFKGILPNGTKVEERWKKVK